jgi:Mce-associated membrane protein
VTLGLDDAAVTATDEWHDEQLPAGWWARAAAFAIDVLCPLTVVASALLVGSSAPWGGWVWWICLVLAVAILVAVAVNRWLLPANTGWSLGRAVLGIAVTDPAGDDPGPGRLLLRDVAHVLDTIPLGLGWLWPLLDRRGRTFADMLTRAEVCVVEDNLPDRRRIATAAIAAAGGLAVLLAVLGFTAVYRQQQSLAAARQQIAEDGPDLVTDMLSYTAKTAQDDFAHAQTLVTDHYRPELAAQQEAVKKAGLVDNDYWVSNSAVVSSTTDQATMLLLLQGQRGVAPKQRFVSASLRVDYEKLGGDWKVANLTVLSAPKPPAAAPAPAETPKPGQPKPGQPKPSGGGR